MAILTEWKNTLDMFRPKNLKLLSLVTLNAFKQAYKTVAYNIVAWMFLLLVLRCLAPLCVVGVERAFYSSSLVYGLYIAFKRSVYYTFIFLWCITVRPSVERKDFWYFVSFFPQFFYLLPLSVLGAAWGALLGAYGVYYLPWPLYCIATFAATYATLMCVTPIIFFALDSDGSLKRAARAHWQGLKMMLYAFPAYAIVMALYGILVELLSLGECLFLGPLNYSVWGHYVLAWLIVPFFVCIMSVIYTKKVHDNSELYN